MSIELALAIPPTIDLCLKYGKELKSLCSSLRQADAEVAERVVRLDNGWLRFTHQLNFLKRIRHVMEDDHRDIWEQTLGVLLGKLEIVTNILRGLVKQQQFVPGSVASVSDSTGSLAARRLKYAFKKDSLDSAIDELETWQRTADQSWFLLMRIADSRIDIELNTPDDATVGNTSIASVIPSTLAIRSGLQGPKTGPVASGSGLTFGVEELSRMSIQTIPYSHAWVAQRAYSNGQVSAYILNQVQCQPLSKYNVIKQDSRDLVRKLQHTDPYTFGLLTCKGLATPSSVPVPSRINPEPDITFTMVFRQPSGSTGSPRSLRDVLVNTEAPSSLSLRFEYAKQLARSISYVHTFSFVHKNVQPESILIFTNNQHTQSLFLVGLENFRRENSWTQRRGDDALDRNLYRHPSRQGPCPREDYIMQHDIYSLGVCLLEIGFWRSFVGYDPHTGQAIPTEILGIPPHLDPKQISYFLQTSGKDHLLHLARFQLARHMGTKYAEIVETCLTCLDPGNEDFGDAREFEDEDGIRVGVRYIEKVVLRLNQLCV